MQDVHVSKCAVDEFNKRFYSVEDKMALIQTPE